MSGHRRGQDTGHGQPHHDEAEPLAEASGKGIPSTDPRELDVRLRDLRQQRVLLAVDRDLRCRAQGVCELGGHRSSRVRLTGARSPGEDARDRGHDGPPEGEPDGEHDRRRREHARRDGYRDHSGRGRDERGPDAAQVEVLERVDVGDHAREEISVTVALQLHWRERLDALVHAHANPTEGAQGEIV